jgi:biotin carboxyl carrier protein
MITSRKTKNLLSKLYRPGMFAGFALLIAGCGNSGPKAEETIEARTPVTVTSPEFKAISETIEFPAVSEFLKRNTIRSTIAGTVEDVTVTPGEVVEKGRHLFTVKTIEATALQKAYKGDTSLVFKGLISINSPDDGVISSLLHQKGDFVQEGDELAILADQNSIVFKLEVPFESRKYIEQSRTCSLRLPDNTFIKGNISGRLPEMNALSQTVTYFVKPSGGGRLPQNLLAMALVNKTSRTDAQVLPRAAILGNETQTEFWVMKVLNDSLAIRVDIKKGIENKKEVEVTDPHFLPEDKILLTGNYGLPDTASIIIKK